MKNRVRLTEGDLHRIVKESVGKVLNEASSEEEEIRAARAALATIKPLYYQAIKSIDALMAECEKFPIESIKHANMLPGCRLAKKNLELFFDRLA